MNEIRMRNSELWIRIHNTALQRQVRFLFRCHRRPSGTRGPWGHDTELWSGSFSAAQGTASTGGRENRLSKRNRFFIIRIEIWIRKWFSQRLEFIFCINQCCGSGPGGSICFGPPGSGSVCQKYGYGSFYHQAKTVRKPLIPNVLWLFYDFFTSINVPSKSIKQKNLDKVFVGILKVKEENNRSRIRIQWSEEWIHGSGSVPTFHGSRTLV